MKNEPAEPGIGCTECIIGIIIIVVVFGGCGLAAAAIGG